MPTKQAMLTGNQIRARFLLYFEKRGHTVVPSSPLVPQKDPTLLFTNAGMNQFKDVFLGREKRDYIRAASAQKCVRAGGKHNDLENVGRTARHHTFFEMLGNFSFGDYFKKEAIEFGWEFLTGEMGLPNEKLWVTVFREDDEAYAIWRNEIGIPEERLVRMGEKDNFWSMGDTGPCGPCSEILIDQGEEMSCGSDCGIGKCDCDRYLELWNLVFMQYDRSADGALNPLPRPSIDTGMGLERITAVVQGVHSNYESDLLRGIIASVEELSGRKYGENPEADVSMRVIADHSRATAFLTGDGVLPSNEGRGYVLRRIMRRAARHAKMLGFDHPVLYRAAERVIDSMAEAYPELRERSGYIVKVVKNEEERFIQTLDNGLRILNEEISQLRRRGESLLPGEVIFRLYDTYGFPVDLTADIVSGENISLDEAGFEACMDRQRQQARQHWKGSGEEAVAEIYRRIREETGPTGFNGYHTLFGQSEVLALLRDGATTDEVRQGDVVEIVTAATPFYGESGGQVGDRGLIRTASGEVEVTDTRKPLPDFTVHLGRVVSGALRKGEPAELRVDEPTRQATALNHTATHLLQSVLVEILGDHVKQAGSLVTPDRLRFDFTHFSPMSPEEVTRVELEVNRRIRANMPVETEETTAEAALASGATALFGEKYGEMVRVVRVGDISMELCGGTHSHAAGDLGLFKILQETGIAAGVRRIEAVTGPAALDLVQRQEEALTRMANLLKTDRQQLEHRVERLLERQRELERALESLQDKLRAGEAGELLDKVKDISGVKVLIARQDNLDGKKMRELSDQLRDRLGSGVIVIGGSHEGKVPLLVAVTDDLTVRLHAGRIVQKLAEVIGGKGGGRPELAQAGGNQPENLDRALSEAAGVISGFLEK